MAIILGLFAALFYGAGDFAAGLGGRRTDPSAVTVIVQILGLAVAGAAVLVYRGNGPSPNALIWGAVSGIGNAVGTLALYRGLAVGQMSVVAPLSAVLTAALPAIAGLALGEHLSMPAAIGIGIVVPAIFLVSRQIHSEGNTGTRKGVVEGISSGIGSALFFIALNQAGTHSGAWPLIAGQTVAVLLVLPIGWRTYYRLRTDIATVGIIVAAGLLGGTANLLFLASTSFGQLSIVAVLTALYPAVTILLARVVLGERWTRLQMVGLVAAGVAIILIASG